MNEVIIIAEAGVNHNGDIDIARRMITAARQAGADYVKFQTAVPELVISAYAPKAEYQKETTGNAENQLEMCRAIHLPLDAYSSLAEQCRREGIGFLSTPFDSPSIETLAELNMDYWKIPSGEVTNLPYLRHIAAKGGKVILSTGMSNIDEVETAVNVLVNGGIQRRDITLLHCNTQYPTPFEDVNLRAMEALEKLEVGAVGYSDHTLGIEIPVAAVALGAAVIEKHFTLDRSMSGPDHRASLEPDELKMMVDAIRNVERALGSGIKAPSASETPNIEIARRSIVASRPIACGEILDESNLEVKRPAGGISPMMWDSVVGTVARRDYLPDEMIEI